LGYRDTEERDVEDGCGEQGSDPLTAVDGSYGQGTYDGPADRSRKVVGGVESSEVAGRGDLDDGEDEANDAKGEEVGVYAFVPAIL